MGLTRHWLATAPKIEHASHGHASRPQRSNTLHTLPSRGVAQAAAPSGILRNKTRRLPEEISTSRISQNLGFAFYKYRVGPLATCHL